MGCVWMHTRKESQHAAMVWLVEIRTWPLSEALLDVPSVKIECNLDAHDELNDPGSFPSHGIGS